MADIGTKVSDTGTDADFLACGDIAAATGETLSGDWVFVVKYTKATDAWAD